jgi:ParB/RepB/Spo0J family partition protein
MKAHGQITNILVRPGDKPGLFDNIDGGRRFQAAKAAELEQLKADLYEGTSDAGEIGAAANMMRAAMHPLDEAKVIARLAANGETLDSIGLRFGKGQRWVEQRQKLDRLSPKAKTLFREARIDMAAAQALTLGTKVQQEQYLANAAIRSAGSGYALFPGNPLDIEAPSSRSAT